VPDPLGLVLRSLCGAGSRVRWCTVRPGRSQRCPGDLAVHLYAVARGRCWVETEGVELPVPLLRGDIAVLSGGSGHRLGVNGPAKSRASAGAVMVCGRVPLETGSRSPFLAELAPVIRLGRGDGRIVAWLHETLCLTADQSRRGGPGTGAIVDLLLEGVLAQALRIHFVARSPGQRGSIGALMDAAIGPTIGRMHEHPGDPWTVASLATEAGLSRSAYAERFSTLAGTTPMQYLLGCRMRTASRLLRREPACLKEIANRVGYASEPAFSAAFKRWSGRSPGAFRALEHGAAPGCPGSERPHAAGSRVRPARPPCRSRRWRGDT
jgi:AraC-like DNA-binding protein